MQAPGTLVNGAANAAWLSKKLGAQDDEEHDSSSRGRSSIHWVIAGGVVVGVVVVVEVQMVQGGGTRGRSHLWSWT